VLPLIAVGLVRPILRDHALVVAFACSAASAVLGLAAAVTIGPGRVALPPGYAGLTILAFAAVAAFALALDWRTTRHLTATLLAAETELAERVAAQARQRETSEILSAI